MLPASAFVDQGNGFLWLPLTLILVGGLERKLGAGRTLLITFGAHLLATLISEGVLLAQIAGHAAPRSDVDIVDVGPSYVILAAIAACLVLGTWKWRSRPSSLEPSSSPACWWVWTGSTCQRWVTSAR